MNLHIKIWNRLRHLYLLKIGPVIRAVNPPHRPSNPDGKVLVHVGCGELNDPRYINIDARAMPHVHHVTQCMDLAQLPPDSVDLIYACHVLEHVPHGKLPAVLSAWFRRLKKGGVLRLSVPDFDSMVAIYRDQNCRIDAINLPLMGGQDYEFNYHYSIFNDEYLRDLLKTSGFASTREWDPRTAQYYDFQDWASKAFIVRGKAYRISLNLEAVK